MTASAEFVGDAALPAAAYHVTVATDFESLEGLCPALRHDSTANDFFSTWSWFENLSRHGLEAEGKRLLVVVRDRGTGAAFCLPLLQRPRARAAVFGPAVGSLSNYYSSLYGVIGDTRALSVDALRAAFAHLRRHHRPCCVIDLQPLDSGHPFYALTLRALAAEGFFTDTYFCFGNWHLEVAGRSFEAYESSIPSRLRTKRVGKKLDRSGIWGVQVHSSPGPALETAITDFVAIYAKSWRVPEPFPDFVPGLCRTAAAQGWLRLGVLQLDGRAIAAQIWIVKERRALIYKIAYDEAFKTCSAGSALSSSMMRRAIDDDGVDDVDYLTGDDAYKVDWMSHRRERRGIVAFHPASVAGLLSSLKHRAGRWRRRLAEVPASPPATASVVRS